MVRLRRKESSSFPFPVTAEVLELRSLLSGAAAAVQGAVHHALAAEQAPSAAGVAPAASKPIPLNFDVTLQFPDVFIVGTNPPPIQTAGILAITPISTTVGSHVTATTSAAFTFHGAPALIGLSVKATVLSSSSNGSTTTVNLAPTGSIRLTFGLGDRNLSGTLRAIAPMTITLDDHGNFTALETAIKLHSSHGTPPPPFYLLAYTS